MTTFTNIKVALVGRRLGWCENLSLGYLHSALEAANMSPFTLTLNEVKDIRKAAERIMASGATLVGLALPETNSAMLALALGALLRRRGYQGHITCGGLFATLTRKWLLDRYAFLDSVIRFAGEVPVVALARALGRGESLSDVPGLTTRAGDGQCAPVLETSASPLRPHRDGLAERLGYKVASVIASRGCPGRCAYCSPAAVQRLEKEEARRQGASEEVIASRGIGGVKRRELDDLCDEMHHLWKTEDVRHFAFADEHLLPFEEDEALTFLDRLDNGLNARGMTNFAMGCQVEASRLTPALVERLVDAGFIRVLLGLDITGGQDGARFSRIPFGSREMEIVEQLNRLGAATVSNVMVIHPYSTASTIEAALEVMSRIPRGIVEALRMFVYEGTRLKEQIAREGRLFGNPLKWEYAALDPVAARFIPIFTALKIHAFGECSIGLRAYESMWHVSLARRLHPDWDLSKQANQLSEISKTIVATYVEAYRRSLVFANDGARGADVKQLVEEFASRTRFISKQLVDVEGFLEGIPRETQTPSRTHQFFTASLFSFCLASSTAAGCYQIAPLGNDEAPSDKTGGTAPFATESETALDSEESFSTESGRDTSDTATDTDIEVVGTDRDTGDTSDTATMPDTESATGCDDATQTAERAILVEAVVENDACFNGSLEISPNGTVYATVDSSVMVDLEELNITGSGAEAMAARAEAVLSDLDTACVPLYAGVFDGGLAEQTQQLMDLVDSQCSYPQMCSIVIDENGRVQDVQYYRESEDPEIADCILSVLDGLIFPCLAGTQMSYAITMIV
jgi:hypothetical protein